MDTLSVGPPSTDSGGTSETPRMLHVQYGGDIKNEIADGINLSPISYSATWDLRKANADAMVSFLNAQIGRTFFWIMPRETAARTWQATRWTRNIIDYDHHRLQVTLEEQFRP